MLATASSFPVRNGKGYGAGSRSSDREFNGRDRVGSVHGIASPNIHASVRAAAFAARQARQFRQKRKPTLFTVPDDEEEVHVREPSPVTPPQNLGPTQGRRKMNLHLSLEKLEKPPLPMMLLHEEPKTDCGPRRKSVLFADNPVQEVFTAGQAPFAVAAAQTVPATRPRRASSITLSMNSPEAAEFNEVAHDGPEELGKRTKRVKKLGKGAGGTVFLSLYLPTIKLVAVKEVAVYQEEDRHMVKRELHALHDNLAPIDTDIPQNGAANSSDILKQHFLAGLRERNSLCPYLVTFYGAFLKPARCAVSVVMEFMDMGSVQDLLDANVTVSEEVLRHAAFCCITALDHMHSQRMVHRDIKPANILMNRHGEFKVADFGLAGTLAKSNSFFSDFTGTMMYMAPERISGAQYTCVSDVWSLGITLFSLATGSYPFTVDDGFFGLEEAICQDTLPPMPNRFSPVCRDFIKRTLNRDPNRRLTSDEALTHPFISGYANTAAFRKFPKLWGSLGLKRATNPEDSRSIVNVAVEYSYRYPDMVILPPEVTGIEPSAEVSPSSQGSPEKRSLFHRFTKLIGHTSTHSETSGRTPFERLADDCGVSTEYLQKLFQEALR
ncbi:serine/threonine protein kinase [Phytophthora cinnamomi]|uniref:serine/threonine protein kinase n=1 Tax=Phytophthora cinnamomi TaxID=4785 RepID=UPI0035598B82|nr:serine/threonine protein kinase [Phytophthora cinnamomi]